MTRLLVSSLAGIAIGVRSLVLGLTSGPAWEAAFGAVMLVIFVRELYVGLRRRRGEADG